MAKKEYGLTKRVPKICSIVRESENRTMGMQAFRLILNSFFVDHSFLAVFDVTTFKLDKTSLKTWTVPGFRPNLNVRQGNASLHVLCAISAREVDMMMMMNKTSVTAADIDVFFSTYFNCFQNKRVVLLVNAAVRGRKDLELVARHYERAFVYNARHNPTANPIEWIFGATKAKYRALTSVSSQFDVNVVLQAFAEVHRSCYHTTIQKCLNSPL